ncbi:UNVERIFIED_CONTAM: hypothetical protein GTU68_046144 [Idotea baltica]|nr:hypothetical protein [Idotea baltica]
MELAFSEYKPRSRAPRTVRASLRDADISSANAERARFNDDFSFYRRPPKSWNDYDEATRTNIIETVKKFAAEGGSGKSQIETNLGPRTITVRPETVSFPYQATKGHPLGIDESGRDVAVQILYATRVSLLFGLSLVISTFVIGIFIGAVQGYFGGKIDLTGQRLTEIWEAMPFLLIMIFLSSVLGRGFFLLLGIYSAFNWISVSYYTRGEFLKLRKQPFVEAARVMGIGRWKIMFRHILPNALVPSITFFPFALVGAIFVLSALDFLGFGLPAGTPSWGNLLHQGQSKPYAWWLVLYPCLALFIVSLLGVFIGEGLRAAFDPKTKSRIE